MNNLSPWSKDTYTLNDFIKNFNLPQLVKVKDAYYGNDEITSLSVGQVMTLHVTQKYDTIVAKDTRNRTVYIRKTCNKKVEVVKKKVWNCKLVAELSKIFPQAARVVSIPETDQVTEINVGDKLIPKRTSKKKRFLECENQNGERVRLPMNLQANFVLLSDVNEYCIHTILEKFALPVKIQFLNSNAAEKCSKTSSVFNSSLGVLNLQSVLKEETVICSTKEQNGGKRFVLTIPSNLYLDITVLATNKATGDDKQYESLCTNLSDEVELALVDALELENIYASRQEIRGYMQLSLLRAQSFPSKSPVSQKPALADNQTRSEYSSVAESSERKFEALETIAAKADDSILGEKSVLNLKEINRKADKCKNKNEGNKMEINKNNRFTPKSKHDVALSSFSVKDVADILTKNHLEELTKTFIEEEIDGRLLLELDRDSLRDLGLNSFQANKLLMLIAQYM